MSSNLSHADVPGLAATRPGWRLAMQGVLVVLATAACGCSTLLPNSKSEVVSAWGSYAQAGESIAQLVPFQATREQVHRHGLDPGDNPAVTVLHFADVLQRFAAATLIKPDEVDRGIRECLSAGRRCSGYAISVKKLAHRRIGDFWLDSLNFRRETVTTGWSVDALLVFVDDLLVYQLVGGHPTIHEVVLRRNPLGPLQGWGEQTLKAMP